MNVLMNQDLLDLYQNGQSKRYKEVERNRELLEGFIRAVNAMTMVNNVSELAVLVICIMNSSSTNGPDTHLFDCQTDLYIVLSSQKHLMVWKLN